MPLSHPFLRTRALRGALVAPLAALSLTAVAVTPALAAGDEPRPDGTATAPQQQPGPDTPLPAASEAPAAPEAQQESEEVAPLEFSQVTILTMQPSGRTNLWMSGTGEPGAKVVSGPDRKSVFTIPSNGTFSKVVGWVDLSGDDDLLFGQDIGTTKTELQPFPTKDITLQTPYLNDPKEDATIPADHTYKGVANEGMTVEATFNGEDLRTHEVRSGRVWSVTREGQEPGPLDIRVTATLELKGETLRSETLERSTVVEGGEEDPPGTLKAEDLAESVTADFDGDDKADLVARNDADGKLYQFKGKGDGTFDKGTVLYDTWDYSHTAAGDFNGDGKADIVATDGSKAWLWRGNGDGTFTKDTKALTNWPAHLQQVSGGDFDNDGIADIAAVNTNENKAYLWRGLKGDTGNPFAPPQYLTNWGNFTQATAGDADGDGTSDIMALDPNGTLKVWISTGDVTKNPFKAPVTIMPFGTHQHLTLGDHNGDGTADVLAVDTTTNEIKTYQSNGTPGTGMLTTPKTIELTIPATGDATAKEEAEKE
ncbi:VCBS repeat-containing protein [Streptomyces sp. NPDC001941]|uniref:FG-GAP repeat domain-containing protein n=1 Tax=Streptomyces sp. NPDC001941 TaxID=3154659 RepID=UPI0033313835